jgi:hypothetical protein
VLFKAKRSMKLGIDPEVMWRPVARNLEVVEVDGTHATAVLPPFVDGLAHEISSRLQQSAGRHWLHGESGSQGKTHAGARIQDGACEPFTPHVDAAQAAPGK